MTIDRTSSNNAVREWWETYRTYSPAAAHTKQTPKRYYTHVPKSLGLIVGMWRIFVRDIPSDACYNYLAMLGVNTNADGEILLTKQQALDYVNFQEMLYGQEK